MFYNFAPRPAAFRIDLFGCPTMTYVLHFIRYLCRYDTTLYKVSTNIPSTVEKLLKRNHTHYGKLIDQALN